MSAKNKVMTIESNVMTIKSKVLTIKSKIDIFACRSLTNSNQTVHEELSKRQNKYDRSTKQLLCRK